MVQDCCGDGAALAGSFGAMLKQLLKLSGGVVFADVDVVVGVEEKNDAASATSGEETVQYVGEAAANDYGLITVIVIAIISFVFYKTIRFHK